jgi:hypothetical protein
MRCLICGSAEGTAGCTTKWKHPAEVVHEFVQVPTLDVWDLECQRLRAEVAALRGAAEDLVEVWNTVGHTRKCGCDACDAVGALRALTTKEEHHG